MKGFNAFYVVFIAMAILLLSGPVKAAGEYPSSPIKLIYGYPPGGGGDLFARMLAGKLASQLKGNVIVENRAGVSAHLANRHVAKSKPDGYTLLFNDAGIVTGPALFPDLGYDLFKDLVPITLYVSTPHALFVNPSIPVKSASEFISHLRTNAGKLAYGSSGTGAPNHLAPLLFMQINKLSALHVPYKATGAMMQDVASNRIQWAMNTLPTVLPLAKDGRLRVLAFGGRTRSSLFPALPTLSETVMPGSEFGTWNGVMAPAQTPQSMLARLNVEIQKTLREKDVRERLQQQGSEPRGSSIDEYGTFLRRETERWAGVIKEAGVKLE